MFSIGSPALLKQVLQSKIAAVKKDVANTMKPFLVILGTGIVTSEDQAWLKQRLKMSQPLRQDVLEMIPRQTLAAVQRLFNQMDQATASDKTIPIGSSLRHLTLQVISGTFLSLTADESDSTFARMYLPIVDESNIRVWHPYRAYLFMLPSFWLYLYHVWQLNTYVSRLIRQRWQLRRREEEELASTQSTTRLQDILDKMLAVYEKECINNTNNSSSSIPAVMSNAVVQQLRDEIKTFMLAGHETSAAMMTWTIYELLGNPTLFQDVAAEGQAVFQLPPDKNDWANATANDLPPPEELAKLVLSEACLKVCF